MNVLQITFSPTGGTDNVAEIITKAWGCLSIKLMPLPPSPPLQSILSCTSMRRADPTIKMKAS